MATEDHLSPIAEAKRGQQLEAHLEPRGKAAENPLFAYVFALDSCLLAKEQQRKQEQEQHPRASEWTRPDNANTFDFKYKVPDNVGALELITTQLKEYTNALCKGLAELPSQIGNNVPIILVGWGYGGLICEKTALQLDESKDIKICGIVLVGTPHYHKGLTRWATLCADPGITSVTSDNAGCRYDNAIQTLSEDQGTFHRKFIERDTKFRVACCFAGRTESRSRASLAVSPDWCVLPGSWVAEIDATYSEMIEFTGKLDGRFKNIAEKVTRWYNDRKEPDTNLGRTRLAQTKSFPGIRWELPSSPGNDNYRVRVGDVVKSKKDMEVLATAEEVKKRVNQNAGSHLSNPDSAGGANEANQEKADSPGIASLALPRAREYAEAAVWLPDVRTQLKKSQIAYLVVGTAMATETKGQQPNSALQQVKGVQLLPIKVSLPGSLWTNGSRLSLSTSGRPF